MVRIEEEGIALTDRETNPLLSESDREEGMILSSTLMMNHHEPGSSSTGHSPTTTPPNSYSNGQTLRRSSYNSAEDGDEDKIHSSPANEESDVIRGANGALLRIETDDEVDECSRLTSPGGISPGPLPSAPLDVEPKGGEYAKIMEMLKEAETSADPEYERKQRNMEFLTKFNPRGGPETRFSLVDYCCNVFQCCAICIEG